MKDIKNFIGESRVSRMVTEGNYDEDMIDLDGSVVFKDNDGSIAKATNMWFENGTVVVRWVYDDNGSDTTSELLEEDPKTIWKIIKSIRTNNK